MSLVLLYRIVGMLFSPFTVISRCKAVGLAETFPFPPISGQFLSDILGFHVSFGNCSVVFSVSSHLFTCPNYYNILPMTIAIDSTLASSNISSFLQCSTGFTSNAHCRDANHYDLSVMITIFCSHYACYAT